MVGVSQVAGECQEIRQKAQQLLMKACSAQDDQKDSVSSLREKARESLMQGFANGALKHALLDGEFANGALKHALLDGERDRMRNKLREVLLEASCDGTLEQALEESHCDAIRGKCHDALVNGCSDGSLQQALDNLSANGIREGSHCDAIREKLRDALVNGCSDGSLQRALGNLSAHGIREKFHDALVKGCSDGSLQKALDNCRADGTHEKACDDLVQVCTDNTLKQDLQALDPSNVLRGNAWELFVNSSLDGRLECALQELKLNVKACGLQEDLEGAKGLARDALLKYVAGGGRVPEARDLREDVEEAKVCDLREDLQEAKALARDALLKSFVDDEACELREDLEEAKGLARDALLKSLIDDEVPCDLVEELEEAKALARDAMLKSLAEGEQSPCDQRPDLEEAKALARDALLKNLAGGGDEGNTDGAEPLPVVPYSREGRAAVPGAVVAYQGGAAASKPLLDLCQAVSLRDRRAGELLSKIQFAKRQLDERKEQCLRLEQEIDAVRLRHSDVDKDVEWHRCAMQHALLRHRELEADRASLLQELALFSSVTSRAGTADAYPSASARSGSAGALAGLGAAAAAACGSAAVFPPAPLPAVSGAVVLPPSSTTGARLPSVTTPRCGIGSAGGVTVSTTASSVGLGRLHDPPGTAPACSTRVGSSGMGGSGGGLGGIFVAPKTPRRGVSGTVLEPISSVAAD